MWGDLERGGRGDLGTVDSEGVRGTCCGVRGGETGGKGDGGLGDWREADYELGFFRLTVQQLNDRTLNLR